MSKWHTLIENFTPNWFTAGMGTGITAIGAYLLPMGNSTTQAFGTVLWLFNIFLVSLFSILTLLRLWLFPEAFKKTLHDPVQSMFFGAIPMAITTIVDGFIDMGPHLIGPVAITIALYLWYVNVAIALYSGLVIPYLMFTSHDHRLDKLTGIWLMPVVPGEVVAAAGGLLIPHFHQLVFRQELWVGSVVLWALSVPIAFLMLGFLFLRLALHNLPPKEMAISTWISLGTIGTGIIGLVGLGNDAPLAFHLLGPYIDGATVFGGLALWGFGLWWLVLSIALTVHYLRGVGLPFNLGWWGLTFPLGVYTVGTDSLYAKLQVGIVGTMANLFYTMLFVFWLIVASRTIIGVFNGSLLPKSLAMVVSRHENA